MVRSKRYVSFAAACCLALAAGCGDDAGDSFSPGNASSNNSSGGENFADAGGAFNNTSGNNATSPNNFVPEVEVFVVQTVAATDDYVFVPNSAEDSTTVARIAGEDLAVTPIRVGREPTQVLASQVDGAGAVAYVLSEGANTIAVVRADESNGAGDIPVSLLSAPSEVNGLRLSPDGRKLLAYIDPNEELDPSDGVASLQTAAVVMLGDNGADDVLYQLSVSRLIRDIEFTDDSETAFLVGREGVNRIDFADLTGDALIRPLDLGLSDSAFPPDDLEIEVSGDGSFIAVRSSQFQGLALYDLTMQAAAPKVIELNAIPTDIDLVDATRSVIVTVRDAGEVAIVDVDKAFADEADAVDLLTVDSDQAGLAQIVPGGQELLLYSTLPSYPDLSVYDLMNDELQSLPLRNAIRSVAVSEDGTTAVVVHEPQSDQATDPVLRAFRESEGLTIVDLATGFRRPIALESPPASTLITQKSDGGNVLYVMLQSPLDNSPEGLLRVDLQTFRTDFVPLPRKPIEMGVVSGRVFVSQESEVGRLTFFDVDTQAQRTISGYELNAEID
jgi:hypothetical protein